MGHFDLFPRREFRIDLYATHDIRSHFCLLHHILVPPANQAGVSVENALHSHCSSYQVATSTNHGSPGAISSLQVKNLFQINDIQTSEIRAAHTSHTKNEVNGLRWLYERSSTSAIHRLVIQALAGLSPNHKARAEEAFSPHGDEIRDEKERMLMDCMELSRDGPTRWIPKDIPNIGGRIEPLFRLEILFPALRREFPSRLFEEHNLDFSRKLSNTLSITLSSIDDKHIQKPTEQNQVLMDALADNGIHYPRLEEALTPLCRQGKVDS